jgi:hypothetical protein
MGMFDQLKCEKELPLNDELKTLNIKWNEVIFQTKDLDNCLSDYRITQDGELVEDVVEKEYTYYTEEERKNLKGWNFIKDQKIIKEYSKKVEYHGTIRFYELLNLNDQEDIWAEFDAHFVYGKLDKIELVKTQKQESGKIRMNKWEEEHQKKINSFPYKLKKRSGYFWLLNRMSRICYKISNFFSRLHTFFIRKMN